MNVAGMTQTEVEIDARTFVLAPGQDVHRLRDCIETAATTGGAFVDFVTTGSRDVSVLVMPTTRVVITTAPVRHDDANDARALPWDGHIDFL